MLSDERTQPQAFIPLAHQQQAAVGSNPRSLEIDSQRGIRRELKRLVLLLTHWVEASAEFVLLSKPHGCWRWFYHTATHTDFKKEMWGILCLQVFFQRSKHGLRFLRPLPRNLTRTEMLRGGSSVQFVSSNCSVGFRCGILVATRVPQVFEKVE